MPSLTTTDGAPVEAPPVDPEAVNRDFSRAMAADQPGGVGSPPRHDEPPAEPAKRRGRPRTKPPADERPRVADKPVDAPVVKVDKDFTEEVTGLTTLGWATLAAVPPTSPWAVVIEANQEDLVKALNSGCQQSPKVRAAVEKWSSGSGGVWALQLAACGVNMSVQSMQLLKDPALRAEARTHTAGKLREFLKANGVKIADPAPTEQPAEAEDAPVAA
jgi:hypothetical protein